LSEILHIPVDRELSERARWLITLRWLTLTIAAAVVLLANHWLGNVLLAPALWGTLVGIAGYNILFWILFRRLERRASPHSSYVALMHAQVLTDLLALTTLLHFSGGLENPFSLYYVLLVLISSILMTKRASYLYATAATAIWVTLLVLEAIGWLPHYNLVGFRSPTRYQQPGHIIAESFVLGSANFIVAYLASSIIERLREGEKQLYEANASCELRAAELSRLNARLQELDRTRSLFMRLVTHELRAPVAAIQSYLRLILDGYVPEERLHEIIAKAEQRARDQLELIGDLLDLARLQEPKDEKEVEPTDLVAILHDVLDMMQARLQDKGLHLEVSLEPDIPPVAASKEHVKQVWINLISNAIKYTPSGGHITVMVECEGDMVRGAVKDTGIGISPEEQERIFDTFYRTEAAKAMERHGTGLGLTIVKGIMERYKGRVWVESQVGQGSTFYFEFPRA